MKPDKKASAYTCRADCWLRTYYTSDETDSVPGEHYETSYEPQYLPMWDTRLRPGQMRILQIEAGEMEEEISTQLHVANMPQHDGVELDHNKKLIHYDALSYSWGYVGTVKEIICNGHRITVLESLWHAVKHLRRRNEDRFIWIDALCINQVDVVEKSSQVARMLLLYYRATNVIAWLGEKNECGHRAIDEIDHPTNRITQAVHAPACARGLRHLYWGLQRLLSRPYFRRTWVRQEIFAARALWVRVGSHEVSWPHFIQKALDLSLCISSSLQKIGSSNVSQGQEQDLSEKDILQALVLLRRGREDWVDILASKSNLDGQSPQTLQDLSLDAALRGSVSFMATDPRDYIYGIVSMTNTKTVTIEEVDTFDSPVRDHALLIDYSRSMSQVFADTTSFLINLHGSLDPIFLASLTQKQQGSLPSWCPDYRHLEEKTLLDSVFYMMDGVTRDSHGPSSTDAEPIRRYRGLTPYHSWSRSSSLEFFHTKAEWQRTRSDGHLRCRGALLGSVISLSRGDHSWFSTSKKFVYFGWDIKPRLTAPDSRYKSSGFKLRRDLNSIRLKVPKGARCQLSSCARTIRSTTCYVPESAVEADLVYQILGTSLPALVRRSQADSRTFILIGALISEAYIWQIKKFREDLRNDWRRMKEPVEEAALDLPVEDMVLV